MLDKGSELFTFEGDLFKLKQKYIDKKFNDETWHELMDEGDKLLKKYRMGEEIEYYCFQMFAAFIDFMDHKQRGEYV